MKTNPDYTVPASLSTPFATLFSARDHVAGARIRLAEAETSAREEGEFIYGGDATVRRPAPDAPAQAWFDYVYVRDNPRGPHDELWAHSAGCRRWFVVKRDTRTHDMLDSCALPGAPAP